MGMLTWHLLFPQNKAKVMSDVEALLKEAFLICKVNFFE